MTYRGHVENGVVVLDAGLMLPEGMEVRVEPVHREPTVESDSATMSLYDRLKDVIGKAEGLPADYSAQHDHYLYGVPKTS